MLQHGHDLALAEGHLPEGWAAFATRLTEALATMMKGQYLIVESTQPQRYVQFACCGADGLRAEAVSNAYLRADDQLSAAQLQSLTKLGWHAPTDPPDVPVGEQQRGGSVNHYVDFDDPAPFGAVADLVVAALAQVFGVADPGRLRYQAFARGGGPAEFPGLGLPRCPANPGAKREEAAVPEGGSASATEEGQRAAAQALDQRLLDAVRSVTGLAHLALDVDGDIGIGFMGQTVYLRVVGRGPSVRLWSPLVFGIEETPGLLRKLNELNAVGGMRVRLERRTVLAEHDIPADPLVPAVLSEVLARFATAVNGLDLLLQQEFGGLLPPGRVASGATRH